MNNEIVEIVNGVTINSCADLFGLMNRIAPLVDAWSLTDPISDRSFHRISSLKVRSNAYTIFEIPKKSGGARILKAPTPLLKSIQRVLGMILQILFEPSPQATAFIAGRSVRDNALTHLGQTCIFNLDLENFFPSITKTMLRKALRRELSAIVKSTEVINFICRISTSPDESGIEVLPQGAPTSPVLSNIVLKSFDLEMAAFAASIGCRYTRYADDITLSHNWPILKMQSWHVASIEKIVAKYGFRINRKKTQTLAPGRRQEVTGIVVSRKLNLPRPYVKQIRALLHLWEKYGYEQAEAIFNRDFEDGEGKKLESVINGKINYLAMIRGKDDPTYFRLRARFRCLLYKKKHPEQTDI